MAFSGQGPFNSMKFTQVLPLSFLLLLILADASKSSLTTMDEMSAAKSYCGYAAVGGFDSADPDYLKAVNVLNELMSNVNLAESTACAGIDFFARYKAFLSDHFASNSLPKASEDES
jgi:hypothetical protein